MKGDQHLDIIDVEKAVEERRVWLQGQLETAADKLGVSAMGRVANTYDMRSAGSTARDDRTDVWLRVAFEDPDYQPACRWDGNVEANAIQGVPKPRVLRWTDWESWRSAPAGYDAAILYCNSLLHPPTAQRIRELFRPVLDTRSGRIALLFAVCRYLWLVGEGGEYESLGTPLRTLGTEVINSL